MYWNLSIAFPNIRDIIPVLHFLSMHLPPYAQTLVAETVIVICWLLLFVYYSTALDNTDISTSNKGKAPAFINGVETYNKEALGDKIRRLIIINAQLVTDKMETEKVRINLEADKTRLFNEKNSLIVKREKLRTEIATLNAANVPVRSYQDPFLRPIQDKLKAKRSPPFDSLKENLQRFFIRIQYS